MKGLDGLISDMMAASTERVKDMDTDKAAKHYGVNPEHVAGYRAMELRMRGVRT